MALSFDLRLGPRTSYSEIVAFGAEAERRGAATLWTSDTTADPFMLLGLVATATRSCEVGTGIAAAFSRSPYAAAQAAWTAQRLSGGRAVIGLGSQVSSHVQRRFGMTWHGAVRQMREYVQCCRAIFATWQTGTVQEYDGEIYQFSLTNPEFDPGPLDADLPAVPIWLAAVGPGMARLAGEVADGVHVHAFHTPSYLRDQFFPKVTAGLEEAKRDVVIRSSSPVLAGVAHNETEAAALRTDFRRVVAFYGSTPAYLPVMAHVGAADLHPRLRALSREGQWEEMAALIDDDLLEQFVTIGPAAEVGQRLRDSYDGVLTQLGIYRGGERFMIEQDSDEFVAALTR